MECGASERAQVLATAAAEADAAVPPPLVAEDTRGGGVATAAACTAKSWRSVRWDPLHGRSGRSGRAAIVDGYDGPASGLHRPLHRPSSSRRSCPSSIPCAR